MNKEDIINFRHWMTYTIQTKAVEQGIDLKKLSEQELSKFAFDAVSEKTKSN
jgi:hypothetical protein